MADLDKSQPCSWCSERSVKGDGDGRFTDSDVTNARFFYKPIPICPNCGGLGIEYDTEDFRQRARRIGKLRFEFYPSQDTLPEPPPIIICTTLQNLLDAVRELAEIYGMGVKNSLARGLLKPNVYYNKLLELTKKAAREDLELIKDDPAPTMEKQATKASMLAYYSGDVEKGEKLLKEAADKYPHNSVIRHDLGVVTIRFKRDMKEALDHFLAATELEPKLALHFYQAAKLLAMLGRQKEAAKYLREAKKHEGYREHASSINQLLTYIQSLNSSNN